MADTYHSPQESNHDQYLARHVPHNISCDYIDQETGQCHRNETQRRLRGIEEIYLLVAV